MGNNCFGFKFTVLPTMTREKLLIGISILWALIFLVIPLLVIIKISIATSQFGVPPYSSLFLLNSDGNIEINIDLTNFIEILFRDFSNNIYLEAYLNSLEIATVSTMLCLILGFPVAYYISRSGLVLKYLLLLLIIIPFLISFLLKIYAWMGMLNTNGTVNTFLKYLGIIDTSLLLLQTKFALYIGMVYAYLPFMIFPLYANLSSLENHQLEASSDLGASPLLVFLTITLKHAVPGIVAGSTLVFLPAIGEYVIPELLGGASTLVIGTQIWSDFFFNHDWTMASAVAVMLLITMAAVFIIAPLKALFEVNGINTK